MTIKKTTKMIDHYEVECKRCQKKITGVSLKSVRHNAEMHEIYCKRRLKND